MDQNYQYQSMPTQTNPGQTAPQPYVTQAAPQQAMPQQYLSPLPKQPWYTGMGKLIAAIIGTGVILIAPAFLYDLPYMMGFDWDEDLVYEIIGALVAVVVIVILGGRQLFRYSDDDRKIAWKAVWWSIAISAVMMCMSIWDYISEGTEIVSDWPINLAYAAALCLGIGFFEEGMVRGCLLGGLMAKFGRTKAGIWFAVIVSSLVFGAMHIDFSSDLDSSDMLTYAQAGLKILQTGMYGFVLAAVAVRTRSIIWPALLHGLDDFLLFVPDVVLLGDTVETEYVSTGEDAMYSVIFYIIICVLYIPLVVKGAKLLFEAEAPDRGAMMGRWEKKRAAELVAAGVEKEGVVLASMAGNPVLAYGAPQGYGAASPSAPTGYGAAPSAPTGYGAPAQPTGQPAYQQQYVQPQYAQPQYAQPRYAGEQAPAQPAQYQQPQYQQPAQPQYQPPAQPQYQPPAQPQYQPPAQPQYGQPQQQYPAQYPSQYPQQGIPQEGDLPTSGQTPPPASW